MSWLDNKYENTEMNATAIDPNERFDLFVEDENELKALEKDGLLWYCDGCCSWFTKNDQARDDLMAREIIYHDSGF